MLIRKWCLIFVAMFSIGVAEASVIQANFDALNDGDSINNVNGLFFSDTMVLSAGVSLNEFEFPPRSGSNVVVNTSGEMAIDFALPAFSVGGYFTYLAPVTLQAYDSVATLLGSITSSFSNNLMISGDPSSSPNEFININSAIPISRIVIIGNPSGFSFVIDDLTYSIEENTNFIPEPGVIALILLAVALMNLLCGKGILKQRRL